MKQPAVYILTNKRDGTLYTGVTSNLYQRIHEHRNSIKTGFTARYNCHRLVYYVLFETMEEAIVEEKKLKAGSRKNKLKRIESMNPEWDDLYASLF